MNKTNTISWSLLKKQVTFKEYATVLAGSLIIAIGYVFFIVPHQIVPGGIIGLSIVIKELTDISIGTIALLINIPLLLWGTKVLGTKTGIKTAISMVSTSFFIDGLALIHQPEMIVKDVLVSSIFGGILIGFSVFIVMKAGATTGGNDILVRILSKKLSIPFEQLILIVDASVVVLGTLVFGNITLAAYSIIAIIAISKTIEYFLKQSIKNKTVLIFSSKNARIQEAIHANKEIASNLVRLIHHDTNEKMIIITKSTKNLSKIESLIYEVDAKANVAVLDSNTNYLRG